VQSSACIALKSIVDAHPRAQTAAGAAGAVDAIVAAAMRLADTTELLQISCWTLSSVVQGHRDNAGRACAAGVIALLAAAVGSSCAHDEASTALQMSVYNYAVGALDALLEGNTAEAADAAVHAGVMGTLAREGTQRIDRRVLAVHARLLSTLQAAAQRHDAAACAHAGCKRCAAAREHGGMCALEGCGARKRDTGKKLNRCGACRLAAYCGPLHQRADWARHKAECAALSAANEQGEQQQEESRMSSSCARGAAHVMEFLRGRERGGETHDQAR
jgi:hypothetical protein